jgi:hypothetical protein
MPKISGKTSSYLEIILKSLEFFEKVLHHFKKASISMKMSSKSLVIFIKASPFSLNVLKKPRIFKKPHSTLKKTSQHFKKNLICT